MKQKLLDINGPGVAVGLPVQDEDSFFIAVILQFHMCCIYRCWTFICGIDMYIIVFHILIYIYLTFEIEVYLINVYKLFPWLFEHTLVLQMVVFILQRALHTRYFTRRYSRS